MDAAVSPLRPVTPLNGDTSGNNGVNGTVLVTMDPARVIEHLAQLLEAALGATREELEAPGSLLSKARYSDTLQRCSRFTNDALVSLYIQKDLPATAPTQLGNGDGEPSMSMLYRLDNLRLGSFANPSSIQHHHSTRTQ